MHESSSLYRKGAAVPSRSEGTRRQRWHDGSPEIAQEMEDDHGPTGSVQEPEQRCEPVTVCGGTVLVGYATADGLDEPQHARRAEKREVTPLLHGNGRTSGGS
jgi:hypothetical protein